MWQPLVTKDFNLHSLSLKSFRVGKCFVPQNIGPCALYYFIINRLAAQSVNEEVLSRRTCWWQALQ